MRNVIASLMTVLSAVSLSSTALADCATEYEAWQNCVEPQAQQASSRAITA